MILENGRIHFISIGGAVMHQLAIDMHLKGYLVTGSDDQIYEPSKSNLNSYGLLPPQNGWFPEKITPDLLMVILGMHAKSNNPELIEAQKKGIPIYSFPQLIYKQAQNKTRVVVSGSHGKTSTTAMIMHILKSCGKRFDYLVGAALKGFERSVSMKQQSDILICQGDQYFCSPNNRNPKFLFYRPHIAIITGISWDHINIYPTFESYKASFAAFIESIQKDGTLIYFEQDEVLKQIIKKNQRSDIIYVGYSTPKYQYSRNENYVQIDSQSISTIVFGEHNFSNMRAAYLACHRLGFQTLKISESLSKFPGASKRLQLIFEDNHALVYRDFAHSPSKLKATIQSVRNRFRDKKLISIFELHTFSSLSKVFLRNYEDTLKESDEKIVFFSKDVIQRKNMEQLNKEDIMKGFGECINVADTKQNLICHFKELNIENSVILLMSSGNYENIDWIQIISEHIKTLKIDNI